MRPSALRIPASSSTTWTVAYFPARAPIPIPRPLYRARDGGRHRRKTHAEDGAASSIAARLDAPTVRLDDRPHDRQAEAHAVLLGREERLEDLRQALRRNPRAGIGDHE